MSAVDAGWYDAVNRFAQDTPWLHEAMLLYSDLGLLVFGVLIVLAWRVAYRGPDAAMVSALWAPVAVLLAYGISNLVKVLVQEPRPCRAMLGVVTVAPCDFATDYGFPSNHAVLAAAAAAAVFVVHRGLGALAIVLALLMGFSRVYVGAHYPHDVMAGLLLGVVVALLGLTLRHPFAPRIHRLRRSPVHTLVGEPLVPIPLPSAASRSVMTRRRTR